MSSKRFSLSDRQVLRFAGGEYGVCADPAFCSPSYTSFLNNEIVFVHDPGPSADRFRYNSLISSDTRRLALMTKSELEEPSSTRGPRHPERREARGRSAPPRR